MRFDKWQSKFWPAIEAERNTAFAWGYHDCVLFAAKIADSISDSGYVSRAKAAFTWTDFRSAAALSKNGLQPLVESVLGEMLPWTRLSQGDIVLIVDDQGRESLTVHDGCQLIGPDEIGFKPISLSYARGGWKVD